MSRIHAVVIGLIVAAAVAVGANAALDDGSAGERPAGVSEQQLQERADRVTAMERSLDAQLRANPPVTKDPVVRYVPGDPAGGSSSASSVSSRDDDSAHRDDEGEDDDHRGSDDERDDDHGRDHEEDD